MRARSAFRRGRRAEPVGRFTSFGYVVHDVAAPSTRESITIPRPTLDAVAAEVATWDRRSNLAEIGVTWRSTTADARTKLARLCPKLS